MTLMRDVIADAIRQEFKRLARDHDIFIREEDEDCYGEPLPFYVDGNISLPDLADVILRAIEEVKA